MYCSKCGNTVPVGTAFCNKCGNRMADQAANQNVHAASQGNTFGQAPGYAEHKPTNPAYSQGQTYGQQGPYAPQPTSSSYAQGQTFGQQPGYAAPQPMYNAPQGQPYAYPQHGGHYPRASSMPNRNLMFAIGGGVLALIIIVGIFVFVGGSTVLQGTWEHVRDPNETITFRGNRFTIAYNNPRANERMEMSGTFVVRSQRTAYEGIVELTFTNIRGTGIDARDLADFRNEVMGEVLRMEFEVRGNTLLMREDAWWGGWDEFRRR